MVFATMAPLDTGEGSSDPSASNYYSSNSYSSSSYSPTWSSSVRSDSNIFIPSKTDSNIPEGKINTDMKSIFDTLWKNEIPGPRLLRATKEFTTRIGQGSQGCVWAACDQFNNARNSISRGVDDRLQRSLDGWTACVIKRIRCDGKQDLRQQIRSTFSEVIRLCHNDLRTHDNIVKLVGWGFCLDSLEKTTSEDPRLPLLVLERAHCDLGMYLDDSDPENIPNVVLREICLGVGRGLGAVHAARYAHGDLKPANVLMFPAEKGKPLDTQRWIPKLCDFGSSNVKQYLGSPGWQPPEYYEQDKDNVLDSLQPCDVFAYGVLVAAVFLRRSSSPLDDFGDLDRDEIRRRCQRQCFFHQAESAVSQKCAATMIAYSTPSDREQLDYDRRDLNMPIDERNRYLAVLRSSMNYHRRFRERQPWRYMNSARFPVVGPISKDLSGHIELMSEATVTTTQRELLEPLKKPRTLGPTLALLRKKSYRQKEIDSVLAIMEYHSHITWDDSDISTFDHPDGPHPCFVHALLDLSDPHPLQVMAARFYAVARLRSRFSIGCWQNASVTRNYLSEYLLSPFSCDIAPLAWFCRGEVGEQELLMLGETPDLLWSCTNDNRCSDDDRSEAFLLLFERGCNIAQSVGPAEM